MSGKIGEWWRLVGWARWSVDVWLLGEWDDGWVEAVNLLVACLLSCVVGRVGKLVDVGWLMLDGCLVICWLLGDWTLGGWWWLFGWLG